MSSAGISNTAVPSKVKSSTSVAAGLLWGFVLRKAKHLPIRSGSKWASVAFGHLARLGSEDLLARGMTRMEAATKSGAERTDPVGVVRGDQIRRQSRVRRLATETRQAFKTTEFWGMVGVIVAILVSAAVIKGGDTNGTDEFIARQAWLYVAIVAGAYFIGRGLAKSGSSDPYTETLDDSDRNGH
jgi:hypothetical protein